VGGQEGEVGVARGEEVGGQERRGGWPGGERWVARGKRWVERSTSGSLKTLPNFKCQLNCNILFVEMKCEDIPTFLFTNSSNLKGKSRSTGLRMAMWTGENVNTALCYTGCQTTLTATGAQVMETSYCRSLLRRGSWAVACRGRGKGE